PAPLIQAGMDIVTHVPMPSVLSADLTRDGLVACPTLVQMRGICATIGSTLPAPLDYENARASVHRLHQASVTILAGTDANADPTAPFSPPHDKALHEELRLLVDAGLRGPNKGVGRVCR
ncbi:hypothetical protein ACLMMR_42945, partial [Streptomyces sp. NPDC000405]